MQPMTQTAFEVALTERTSEMLDACTKCGKCVEIYPVTAPAGSATPRRQR
jgi:ferredoxin